MMHIKWLLNGEMRKSGMCFSNGEIRNVGLVPTLELIISLVITFSRRDVLNGLTIFFRKKAMSHSY